MRTSILSRSVVAVATLAIGSVALAATPATAASAQGVTREQVLTVVNIDQLENPTISQYTAYTRALRSIVVAGCDVSAADGETPGGGYDVEVFTRGDDAEGVIISTYVESDFGGGRPCTIAAFATADASFQLSGTANITIEERAEGAEDYTLRTLQSSALSGDAFVTAPVEFYNYSGDFRNPTASATGNATKTTTTTTSTKVKDKKTKSEKKKAKAAYAKKIKSVKKSYAKALDKAGKSKSKKAAAKKAYKAKRAAAKAKYAYAIAGYKLVKKSTSSTENRPFSIATALDEPTL